MQLFDCVGEDIIARGAVGALENCARSWVDFWPLVLPVLRALLLLFLAAPLYNEGKVSDLLNVGLGAVA